MDNNPSLEGPDSPDDVRKLPKSEDPTVNEIIYILTNPVIPGLIKIGRTTDLKTRVRNISSHEGVPVPFEVHYACVVTDSKKVERHIHEGFGDHRVNPKREFFRINPERVRSILKLVEIQDITPDDDYVADQEEQQSLNKERSRRTNFKFSSADIPIGAELHFIRDDTITAEVVDDRRVKFEGEVTSLSGSAAELLSRASAKKPSGEFEVLTTGYTRMRHLRKDVTA